MHEWDNKQYLKFKKERTQPSIDLINRLDKHNSILDIGCGPGNSTKALLDKYPNATILGCDFDNNMINKAIESYKELKFVKASMPEDFNKFDKYDLIFSNACIHWIKDQEKLFNEIYNHLNKGGELAFQIPLTQNSEFYKILYELIDNEFKELKNINNFHNLDKYGYYNLLNKIGFKNITIWETNYVHKVNTSLDVIEWYKGSGLRPYLDKCNNNELLLNRLNEEIIKRYHKLNDDSYFLIMPRLFVVAKKED